MSEDSANNDQPPPVIAGESPVLPAKRKRGRPKGVKNKPTAEDLALQTAAMDDEGFRGRLKQSRQEVYELASQKLLAAVKADKLSPSSLSILWGIAHDKVTAEAAPSTVINQQINVSGVGRSELLKGLGVARSILSESPKIPKIVGEVVTPAAHTQAKRDVSVCVDVEAKP